MSLETTLKNLTAAIEALTAAIPQANSAPASGSNTARTPKPSAAKAEPAPEPSKTEAKKPADVPSAEKKDVTGVIVELAKKKGRETAMSLLAEFKATKVPELDEKDYGAVFAKATALLEA